MTAPTCRLFWLHLSACAAPFSQPNPKISAQRRLNFGLEGSRAGAVASGWAVGLGALLPGIPRAAFASTLADIASVSSSRPSNRLFREWSAGKGGGYPRFGVVSV